ncbi:MAG: DUF2807 domain-containing protein [Treponema sp.]|jgi:hypothetical protein|nr:DUF2807 domain-containing protein [Treponema sp.]
MKKSSFTAMAFIIGFSAICMSCAIFPIIGNGNLVSNEITVSQFEKINVSGSAEVRFHVGQGQRVVVTVDSNLSEYVDIFTRNKELNIRLKNRGSYSFTKFLVDVYCPVLTGVSVSGSGSFAAMDKITASSFEANISGSGKTEGIIECRDYSANISGSGKITNNVVCDTLTANISGSGEITITGTGRDSTVKISGSGDFYGIEFKTNNVSAQISGSGNMQIWVLDYLKANVAGSGSIRYRGNPTIDYSGSGSGRLRAE